MDQAGRPDVTVRDPSGPLQPVGSVAPDRRRTRPLLALGLAVALLGGLLLYVQAARPAWSVGPARLVDDGTLAVPLTVRTGQLVVPGIRLRAPALVAIGQAALSDEVEGAQERGVVPVHDPARALGPGRYTVLVGVRARCSDAGPSGRAEVLLDTVSRGVRRLAVSAVPRAVRDRLVCRPLTLRAGLSPASPVTGQVTLLLTAYVGVPGPQRALRSLVWPCYRVSGVSGVVAPALARAGADGSVVFPAVVRADCAAPVGGSLTAVLAGGEQAVPLTDAAARRVGALRDSCG